MAIIMKVSEFMRNQFWVIEILSGLAGGIAAALLGGLFGALLSGNQDLAGLAGAVGGMLLAFPLGVGAGLGYIAYRRHHHKRPWLGVAGAILGIFFVLLIAEPTGLTLNTVLLLIVTVIVCCLSAWAALHLPERFTRRDNQAS